MTSHAPDPALAAELRALLDAALAGGMRAEPVAHARQVAAVAYDALRVLASASDPRVDAAALEGLLDGLHRRPGGASG